MGSLEGKGVLPFAHGRTPSLFLFYFYFPSIFLYPLELTPLEDISQIESFCIGYMIYQQS